MGLDKTKMSSKNSAFWLNNKKISTIYSLEFSPPKMRNVFRRKAFILKTFFFFLGGRVLINQMLLTNFRWKIPWYYKQAWNVGWKHYLSTHIQTVLSYLCSDH